VRTASPHHSAGSHALLLLLALTACATPPAREPSPTVLDLASPRYSNWQIRGRVSLVKGDQGWHANLNWRENAGRYQLDLSGPLGQGAVRLEGDAAGVRLRTANGHDYVAEDADALVQAATGWQLPVAGIRYWVRGVPVPGRPALVETDADRRLVSLTQSGWKIRYERFQDVDGRAWPTRMQLTTDDLSVRLVVDDWTLGSPPAGATPSAASAPSP
jgi:outer membrane lipoprotein LolB